MSEKHVRKPKRNRLYAWTMAEIYRCRIYPRMMSTTKDNYLCLFSMYIFCQIQTVFFYLYPETRGKKGVNGVCSLFHDFVHNSLSQEVREIEIYSDSCSGQNKNYTVFRFMHYLIHTEKRFDKITMIFPVRGHSYMEVDKNVGLIPKQARCETPEDWLETFQGARSKPTPFHVKLLHNITDTCGLEENVFLNWNDHLDKLYKKKNFLTRPIKEFVVCKDFPEVKFRSSYNGGFEKASILTTPEVTGDLQGQFMIPSISYLRK